MPNQQAYDMGYYNMTSRSTGYPVSAGNDSSPRVGMALVERDIVTSLDCNDFMSTAIFSVNDLNSRLGVPPNITTPTDGSPVPVVFGYNSTTRWNIFPNNSKNDTDTGRRVFRNGDGRPGRVLTASLTDRGLTLTLEKFEPNNNNQIWDIMDLTRGIML